jgi:branched-subunit amino acid ABC-type transport system permease component
MWTFLNQLIDGLILSGPILLIAVSLSAVLASSRVLNVAIGASYALVAVVCLEVEPSVGVAGVIVIGLFGPVVIFLLMDTIVLSIQRRQSRDPVMGSFAATLGVSLILTAVAAMITSSATLSLPPNFLRLGTDWKIGGLQVPEDGTVVVGAAAAALIAFWLLLYHTSLGAQFRATASDPFLAKVAGIRPGYVIRLSWVVSGLFCGVATVLLLIVDRTVSATSGSDILLVPFAAVIAGGMGSPLGAALASIFFGVAEALLTLVTSSGGLQSVLVFGILFVLLVVRPEGLSSASKGTRAY